MNNTGDVGAEMSERTFSCGLSKEGCSQLREIVEEGEQGGVGWGLRGSNE